jgi:hypothetical protein
MTNNITARTTNNQSSNQYVSHPFATAIPSSTLITEILLATLDAAIYFPDPLNTHPVIAKSASASTLNSVYHYHPHLMREHTANVSEERT